MSKDWDDPLRPLPIEPDNKSKDDIIADLHEKLHTLGNQYQSKYSLLELENIKLKRAMYSIINFEWNAWTEAKALLISIDGECDGAFVPDTKKSTDPSV